MFDIFSFEKTGHERQRGGVTAERFQKEEMFMDYSFTTQTDVVVAQNKNYQILSLMLLELLRP